MPKDEGKAFAAYKSAAEAGVACAQYVIGCMYQGGVVVQNNDVLSVKWYTKSARQGHKNASYMLAYLYKTGGYSIERDVKMAFCWYQKAAELGDSGAARIVARAYEEGELGVKKSEKDALEWYHKAADMGDIMAQGMLSQAYKNGFLGLQISKSQADFWSKKSDETCQKKDREEFERCQIAAMYGVKFCQKLLVEIYRQGLLGVPINEEKAQFWEQKGNDELVDLE